MTHVTAENTESRIADPVAETQRNTDTQSPKEGRSEGTKRQNRRNLRCSTSDGKRRMVATAESREMCG